MRQLLRLMTALMLLFGLCQTISAQRRGTTKFISSPDQFPEWESQKLAHGFMSRADVVSESGRPRRIPNRSRDEIEKTSPSDGTEIKDETTAKIPTYRVRGRSRPKLQHAENHKKPFEVTTEMNAGQTERNRVYKSNRQRHAGKTENESNGSSVHTVHSTTHYTTHSTPKRKNFESTTEEKATTVDLPVTHSNHRTTYADEEKLTSPTQKKAKRRYRIRVVEANTIASNSSKQTTGPDDAIADNVKRAPSTTEHSTNTKSGKADNDPTVEEPNYPEHFKALLKSKKTAEPSQKPQLNRVNGFVPRKQQSTTTAQPETTTTLRPAYKHKKIDRPNLKLLFPSLQTSSTSTTEKIASHSTETDGPIEIEHSSDIGASAGITSTTAKNKIRTTIQKQLGGLKFSSKVRMNDDPSSQPTPLIFDAPSKSPTTYISSEPNTPLTIQRSPTVTGIDPLKFSARFKSADSGSSLAAYRKNLLREKPPFYTPTTPPITTQANEIDWAASDYSYQYSDIEPVRSGLMQNPPLNVETSHHSSSSVTVSIFGALSEILSHTTESLSFLTSTTERIPQSHTHSTLFSTDDTKSQIQKVQDRAKTAKTIGDTTSTTSLDSNDFRLPIQSTFDSKDSGHSPTEQVVTIFPSSNSIYSTRNALTSTATTLPFADTNTISVNSVNEENSDAIKNVRQSRGYSNSSDVMVVFATSDKSTTQRSPTTNSIKQTDQTSNTQFIMSSSVWTKNKTVAAHNDFSTEATHSTENAVPLYPVYAVTMSPTTRNDTMSLTQATSAEVPHSSTTPMPPSTTLPTTSNSTHIETRDTVIIFDSMQFPHHLIDSLVNNELSLSHENSTDIPSELSVYLENSTKSTNNDSDDLNQSKFDDREQIMTNNNFQSDLTTPQYETETSIAEGDVNFVDGIGTTTTSMALLNSLDRHKERFMKDFIEVLAKGMANNVVDVVQFLNRSATALNIKTVPSMLEQTTDMPNSYTMGEGSEVTMPEEPTTMQMNAETTTTKRFTTRRSSRYDFFIYGILPNNTVIRKYPEDVYDDDDSSDGPIVYGILANKTILRRYPNGMVEIANDRKSLRYEITNIDPRALLDSMSSLYAAQTSVSPPPLIDDRTTPDNHNMHYDSNTTTKSSLNFNNSPSSNYTNANSTSNPRTSVEQLNEYLRKANQSQVHTKSENVFSLAPPTSSSTTNGFGSDAAYRPVSLDDYDSLPSSNEVTSNESIGSKITDDDSDPFSLSSEFDDKAHKPAQSVTSPKSNREYITSFTTTTTTTQKPHIEKGVKIIRNLVEQSRTTEQPDSNRPIQSLTTMRPMVVVSTKDKSVTTAKPKSRPASTTLLPANHRPASTEAVSPRQQKKELDGFDSTEKGNEILSEPTSPRTTAGTTKSSTTKTTTRGTSPITRASTTEGAKTTTTQLPISINDIEDLLQNVQSTTKKIKPMTSTTQRTKASINNDDLGFLVQVQRLLQRPSPSTKSTTKATTTTSAPPTSRSTPKLEIITSSRDKTERDGPTSTFDDLLNSFQTVPTTTRRPVLTTFSDVDDIAFLNGLRSIATIETSTTKTTRNPNFANQIIQLALNRTTKPKEASSGSIINQLTGISNEELEKNKKDEASLKSDLQLLSTLLGRPVSQKEIPQLSKQASTQLPISSFSSTTTVRTKSTAKTGTPIEQEIELLQKIIQKPNTTDDNGLTSTDELAAVDSNDAYGKTNDALLATLLKQRGIGPAHNNIPLSIYSSTTARPRATAPSRSPRPILDGLTWLWRTWQDTAPGTGGYQSQTRTRIRNANTDTTNVTTTADIDPNASFDDGLDADTSSQPLDQSNTNGNTGFGFGSAFPGGQLLSAALGMTRAVTQFLGSALQGAGKSIQTAWSTQAFGSASGGGGGGGGSNYFRLSG